MTEAQRIEREIATLKDELHRAIRDGADREHRHWTCCGVANPGPGGRLT